MKNLKDQKGITLVALVITIIVLLILAGISLQLVVGDTGILTRAQNANESQKLAGIREKVELEVANVAADYYQKKYVEGATVTQTTVGEYIQSKSSDIETALKLDTGDTFVIASFSGNEATATLTVGSESYTGKIDKDGKWTKPIKITKS